MNRLVKKTVVVALLFFVLMQNSLSAQETTPDRFRRWGISPYVGFAAFLTRLNDYNMAPAIALGLRSTFQITPHIGVGLQVNADFIHFGNDDGGEYDDIDLSSLTPLFLVDLNIPDTGLHFGPYLGISYKHYQKDDGWLFTTKGVKGTENLLAYGAYVSWLFRAGKRVSLGPRVDLYHYSATHTDHIGSHSVVNAYFTTKFSF